MNPNAFVGVFFHWLGGLAAGSFYVPYRGVKNWAWEVYWLVGGLFSWLIAPSVVAFSFTNDLLGVLRVQSLGTLWWTYFFGALWGVGGLTFGLTMRYLGMSLGMGMALGYCAALGTLVPPLAKSLLPSIPVASALGDIVKSVPGLITLGGVGVCLLGIWVAALAGLTKEREMSEADKKKSIAEFDFGKGLLVATFAGIMSACFAFGLTAGNPIADASRKAGTPVIWSGLPKLIVVLAGGFTTNFIWCALLNLKNRTWPQYVSSTTSVKTGAAACPNGVEDSIDSGATRTAVRTESATSTAVQSVPMLRNYLFSALAGTTWYFQFFFYTMGETQMGKFGFASWTLHMASIIIFSTMWGWIFHEWKGSSKKAHSLIAAGIVTLILSTMIIGLGTYLRNR